MKPAVVLDDSSARKAVAEAPRRCADALEAAMFRRAQDLLDIAAPLTPKKTGRLWASRYATRTSPVEVGFSSPYALSVHERHSKHWKFLEQALLKIANGGGDILAKHFWDALEAGEKVSTAPARHPAQAKGGG